MSSLCLSCRVVGDVTYFRRCERCGGGKGVVGGLGGRSGTKRRKAEAEGGGKAASRLAAGPARPQCAPPPCRFPHSLSYIITVRARSSYLIRASGHGMILATLVVVVRARSMLFGTRVRE